MIAVKEHPIIFSTESVKAILDGRKTQTRRVAKPRKTTNIKSSLSVQGGISSIGDLGAELRYYNKYGPNPNSCPYGQVGDRLWVRETWAIKDCGARVPLDKDTWADGFPINRLQYVATDPAPIPPELADDSKTPYWWNKRPSIFMPRWASRITLEITDIRVERVQEITYEDCYAEGIARDFSPKRRLNDLVVVDVTPKTDFMGLWNSLNAKRGYGWEVNPWVWVISFKRV